MSLHPPPFTIVYESFFLFSFVRVWFFRLFENRVFFVPFGIFIQLLKLEFYSFLAFFGFFDLVLNFYSETCLK